MLILANEIEERYPSSKLFPTTANMIWMLGCEGGQLTMDFKGKWFIDLWGWPGVACLQESFGHLEAFRWNNVGRLSFSVYRYTNETRRKDWWTEKNDPNFTSICCFKEKLGSISKYSCLYFDWSRISTQECTCPSSVKWGLGIGYSIYLFYKKIFMICKKLSIIRRFSWSVAVTNGVQACLRGSLDGTVADFNEMRYCKNKWAAYGSGNWLNSLLLLTGRLAGPIDLYTSFHSLLFSFLQNMEVEYLHNTLICFWNQIMQLPWVRGMTKLELLHATGSALQYTQKSSCMKWGG